MLKPSPKLSLLGLLALSACQTAPHPPSGFLGSYEDVQPAGRSLRAAVRQRRDDAALSAVKRVYLEPAILVSGEAQSLSARDRQILLREVDRQLCFELSRWFDLLEAPAPDAGRIRTAVVEIRPTGRLGSAASAAIGFVNPIPLTDIRIPTTTGGLAVEAELIGPDGDQLGAITWARNANIIGRDGPSLSRVGDALQMTEPMGKAVRRAFAADDRKKRAAPKPDPCAQFGPRRNPTRWVAGKVVGRATGLYVPEVDGLAAPAPDRGELDATAHEDARAVGRGQ